MVIVCDTREGLPYSFERYPDVQTERVALATGDYSLENHESVIACERKSLNDLIMCLQGNERVRFERELSRGALMQHFYVIVEASFDDVAKHRYRSKMSPKSVLQSIFAFSIRYGTNFVWCCSRDGGEYCCYSLMSKYLHEMEKRINQAVRGAGNPRSKNNLMEGIA